MDEKEKYILIGYITAMIKYLPLRNKHYTKEQIIINSINHEYIISEVKNELQGIDIDKIVL